MLFISNHDSNVSTGPKPFPDPYDYMKDTTHRCDSAIWSHIHRLSNRTTVLFIKYTTVFVKNIPKINRGTKLILQTLHRKRFCVVFVRVDRGDADPIVGPAIIL